MLFVKLPTEKHESRIYVVIRHPPKDKLAFIGEILILNEYGANQPEHVVIPRLIYLFVIDSLNNQTPFIVACIIVNNVEPDYHKAL